jgi:hypothetical protein
MEWLAVVALLAVPQDVEDWFKDYPFTLTDAGVGGRLEIRVTDAGESYSVSLYDPAGGLRRSTSVSPAVGVFFTATADRAGVWTVTLGRPYPTLPVSARVEFSVGPGAREIGGGGGSCGLLGLEVLLFLALARKIREVASVP